MEQHCQLITGEQLYKYQLQNRIGGGGFGDVWLAHDHSIDRDIAVKVLDASTVSIDERLREAQIGNHLQHANLVKVHYADIVTHKGINLVIIAMDYYKNGSILGRINAGNFIPIPIVVKCLIDILRGLEYLHEQGIYHGDIKPQNILLGASDEGVLTDYGISCYAPSLQPVQPRSAYKLHIAPEILNDNHINIQTDIYQVGLTAFRLINGIGAIQDKFNKLGEQKYYQLVQKGNVIQTTDYQPFVPRTLKAVINKAIHVDPSRRYQSAVEMRRALERLSYPGFWTLNAAGIFEGYNSTCEFWFDENPRGGSLYDFTALRKNKTTGRETRIHKFCLQRANRKQTDELKGDFMQYVVLGG